METTNMIPHTSFQQNGQNTTKKREREREREKGKENLISLCTLNSLNTVYFCSSEIYKLRKKLIIFQKYHLVFSVD